MSWIDRYRMRLVFAAIALPAAVSGSALAEQAAPSPIRFVQQAAAPSPTQSAAPLPATQPQHSPAPAAIPLPPLTPEQLGDTMMARQRYQAAIEAYKKAQPDSATLWNKMGIAYQMMLNLDEARHCYEKSLKLDPKNSVVLNNLGTIYDSLKEYPSAERMYRRALKYDPKSALIYKNLGTNLLTQHKYKKGWETYKEALTYDPDVFGQSGSPRVENPASVEDRGAMNYYMAKGCLRAGMKDQAIEYLRMALNEGFTNPKKIMADSEFASLRGIPAFEQLIASQSAQ
jgi:tetratricopeptide (TPR) repeat protein